MKAALLPADAASMSSADCRDPLHVATAWTSRLHLACGTSMGINDLTTPRILHELGRPALDNALHLAQASEFST